MEELSEKAEHWPIGLQTFQPEMWKIDKFTVYSIIDLLENNKGYMKELIIKLQEESEEKLYSSIFVNNNIKMLKQDLNKLDNIFILLEKVMKNN